MALNYQQLNHHITLKDLSLTQAVSFMTAKIK